MLQTIGKIHTDHCVLIDQLFERALSKLTKERINYETADLESQAGD